MLGGKRLGLAFVTLSGLLGCARVGYEREGLRHADARGDLARPAPDTADLGSPDHARPELSTAKPDLACVAAASQPATSGGYLNLWDRRAWAQLFTPGTSGRVSSVSFWQQALNGGDQEALFVAVVAVQNGLPTTTLLVEQQVSPLVAGWKQYGVSFASGPALQAGTTYALRLRSAATAVPHHTLAFAKVSASPTVGPLFGWAELGTGWLPAGSIDGVLAGAVLAFEVRLCP